MRIRHLACSLYYVDGIPQGLECILGSVRLVNSSLPSGTSYMQGQAGIVELCVDGRWSRICSEGWDYRDAVVTCTQLGLPSHGIVIIYNIANPA